jgi:tRNA(Ile)-lysidine synthase
LPGGIFAMGDKTELVISRERARLREIKPFSYSLTIPGEVRIEEIGKTIRGAFATEFNKQNDPNIALIDYAALGKEIVVRNKLPGDRFTPLGVKGTKKLQDYFVDEKLPADERDLVPIVESGGKIVWVAGQRIDENAKVTDKTAKIVKLELL